MQRGHLDGFLFCHPIELEVGVAILNPSPSSALGSAIECREVHTPYGPLPLIALCTLSSIALALLILLELAEIFERECFPRKKNSKSKSPVWNVPYSSLPSCHRKLFRS